MLRVIAMSSATNARSGARRQRRNTAPAASGRELVEVRPIDRPQGHLHHGTIEVGAHRLRDRGHSLVGARGQPASEIECDLLTQEVYSVGVTSKSMSMGLLTVVV